MMEPKEGWERDLQLSEIIVMAQKSKAFEYNRKSVPVPVWPMPALR